MKSFRSVCWGLLCLLLLGTPAALAQTITTIAGTGFGGFSSDGIAATNSQLNTPYEVAIDTAGNIYIADYNNTRIRRIGTNGLITTVAGTGVNAFGGDGGPATSARLTKPTGVYVDGGGNIFIADTGNNRVRKVDASTGDIDTIAGTGSGTFGGDGGPATAAQIATPYSVLLDAAGNIYITDSINNRIRKIDAGSGDITTFAGTGTAGFSGDGGPAASADINRPAGMAFDTQGNLFFSDFSNNRVRKIDTAGNITTVAGTGSGTYNGDGIQATNASLAGPRGISVDSLGRIFIADATHHRIRMVDTNGLISTYAGTGVAGFSGDGGPASLAQFDFPSGVQVNTNGDVFVTDQNNHRIRRIIAPVFTTVAGTVRNASTGNGLPGVSIRIGTNAVLSDASGNYAITNLALATVQIVATNTGFVGLTNSLVLTNAPTNLFNFAMSPVILGANTFRIVLTWGAQPRDLDSYTLTPKIAGINHEIYFGNPGSLVTAPFAQLDVDDVNGFGPETTTITNLFPGTYEFYVDNFSISPAIAGSGAQVEVYSAAGLLQTITVPATGSGTFWRVFQIDGNSGIVTVLNVITNVQPTFPASSTPTIVNQPVSQTGFRSNSIAFNVTASGAAPLAYQWFFNTNALLSATNATLTLANLQTNQAGDYFVVVTNSFGSVTSTLATLTVLTNSQPPPFQWVNTIAGIADDVAESVKVDAAGNSYLAGFFSAPISFGVTNLVPIGTIDAFVAKYDARGVCQWAVHPGGRGVAVDNAGNVIVSGGYTGTVNFGPTNATSVAGFDVHVVKYNSAGVLQWSRQYGSTLDERGTRVATDAAGNIYVAGEFASNLSFGTNNLVNQGARDLFLIKFNSAGTLLWARPIGGSGDESNARVAVDAGGNALVTGAFQGTASLGTNVLTSLGASDIFVAKYDPNGNVLWARRAGGPGDDLGNEITVDSGGNAFVTGEFNGVAGFGSTNLNGLGGSDAFVAKYDAAGTLVRVWQVGSSGEDRGRGVGVDAVGNLYLHGDFTGVLDYRGLLVTSAGGTRDVFVLKMDGAGNPIWLKRAGSAGTDTSGNLAVAASGDVFLTGSSSNLVSFDNLSFANAGANDIYFTKIPANLGPVPVPTGLVGWWAAEGFAVDYAWTNHGAFFGGATNGPGKVGSAFSLDGVNDAIVMTTNALNTAFTNLTIEAWVFPTAHGNNGQTGKKIISKTEGHGFGFSLYDGAIHVDLRLTSGNVSQAFGGPVPLNTWSHVAFTYDGTRITAYVNGAPVGSVAATGSVRNTSNADVPLAIGREPLPGGLDPDAQTPWVGLLDEISVYSRALAPTEMQTVFTADAYGKARPAAPTILVPPPALTVVDQGAPATLGVAAAGYAPLAYQWRLNGTNLPGQTNFSLSIPAAYSVHEGNYDVRITQLDSVAVTSPPAVLNVLGQGEARTLFGVTNDVANFIRVGGGAVPWTLTSSNTILVVPGSGSIQSTQNFGDFILHAEFRCPSPTDGANGNSGIYLQNRYEIQIFNSFGVSVPGLNDAGAIWGQTPASTNAALPAGQWQTYDIIFRQAQWNGNTKFANARVTVVLNGVTVQNDVALTGPTTGGAAEGPTPGPVVLQDNGSAVQFRNVRITPLDLPPEFQRGQSSGGSGIDQLDSLFVDQPGNSYIAGRFTGTATIAGTALVSAGLQDNYIARFGPSGNALWVRQIGSTGDDAGHGIFAIPNGDAFASGRFVNTASFGTTNLTSVGQSDIFLARYDGNGTLIWARKAGGTGTDAAYAVTADAGGNAYITGDFSGTADFGGIQLTSGATLNSFVAKYDPTGALIWAVRIGGTGTPTAKRITLDSATNVYVGGSFQGTVQFATPFLTSAGLNDGFVLKLNSSGVAQWVQQFGGTGDDAIRGVSIAPDGTINVGGLFQGTVTLGTNTLNSSGGYDAYIAKLDTGGNPLWARKAGSSSVDSLDALATDPLGAIYAAGAFAAQATFNATSLVNSGTADLFVVKYDANGNQQWVRRAGNANSLGSIEVGTDAAGIVRITGQFSGALSLDSLSLTNAGQQDIFIAALASTPPVITQQPLGGNVLAGQNTTLSIMASGTGLITYQWRLNGTNITGATNAAFIIPNATTNAAGTYDVQVTHVYGTATSTPAVLTVIPSTNPLPFTFAERFGGTNADSIQALARDAAGNSYLAGYFSSTLNLGVTNLTSAGGFDLMVIKVDPAGTVLWAAQAGGPGEDRATSLALDPNGDVVVAGWFDNGAVFGTNGPISLTVNLAAFVARLTSGGQFVSVQKIDSSAGNASTYRNRNFSVAVDSSGAVYATGKADQSANFGSVPFNRPNVWSYLVKYDRAGSVLWIQGSDCAPGASQNVVGMAVALDNAGNVYWGGYYGTPGGTTGTNAIIGGVTLPYGGGDADGFLAKFTSAGAPVWVRGLNGAGSERVLRLAPDAFGNVFVSGDFQTAVDFGSGALTPSTGFGQTGLLLKLNSAGTVLWAREAGSYGGGNLDDGALATDAAGNVYLANNFIGTSFLGSPTATSLGGRDAMIAKFGGNGNFLWVQTFGSTNDDFVNGIVVDTNQSLHVAGTLGRQAVLGPFTLTNAGSSDLFLATIATQPPAITTQPVSQTIGINQSVTFTVAATGTLPFTYQWRCNGTNLPGATNASFSIPAVIPASAGTYSVLVGDALGIATSSNATLTVDTSGLPFVLTPPQSQTVPQGSAVLLTVDAVGALPLSYQWRKNGTNLAGEVFPFLALNGTTTNTSGAYTVVLTNVFGAVTSAPAAITVVQIFPPVITNHPQSLIVREGSNATFSVAASGTAPFNYQWVRGGNAIPNNDQPTLTITNATLADADTYFVQIFNSAGLATSQPATLTVHAPPVFLSVPQPVTALQGGTALFSAVASGVPTPAYSWYKDGVRLTSSPTYSGVITTNLLVLGAQAGQLGSYVVIATNVAGAITSAPVALTLLFAPTITTHPTNVTLTRTNYAAAMPVTLSVAASGAPPLFYQWRFNNLDLADETNTTLTLANVTRLNNGFYQAVVTNLAGSAASSNALVRVRVPQRVEPPIFTPGAPFRLRFVDDNGEQAGPTDLTRLEVQAAASLQGTNTVWVKLTNGFSVVNGMLEFDDPSVTNLVRRYYRIIEK